jgi:hypothetical protein
MGLGEEDGVPSAPELLTLSAHAVERELARCALT